jgi:hypothetical protein
MYPTNVDEWRSCLVADPPQNGDSLGWRLACAAHVLSSIAWRHSIQELPIYIAAYQEACPGLKGSVLPFLLSSLSFPYSDKELTLDRFRTVLSVLPGLDIEDGEIKWLEATRDWVSYDFLGDLLSASLAHIEKYYDDHAIEKDSTYQHAVAHIKALIKSRDTGSGG